MLRRLPLYLAIFLGFLVGALYLTGLFLPVEHEASVHRVFRVAPERLWSVLTDYEQYPQWRPDVAEVASTPFGWTETDDYGDSTGYEIEEQIEPHRFVVRIQNPGAYGGSWEYALEPEDGGTRLTIIERGEVFNPMLRVISRFIIGHTATMQSMLDLLQKRLEEG